MLDMAVIEIGGEKYTLCYPLKTLMKAERLLKKPLKTVFVTEDEKKPIADYVLEDLLILFKLGLEKEYPNFDNDKAFQLFEAFLQEGDSVYQQMTTLFLQEGKAAGFFRTEIDFQKEVNARIKARKESRK